MVTTGQKVGVGTAAPDQLIHVKNDVNAIAALRVENGNIMGASAPTAQEQFVLGPAGSEHLILQVLSDSHPSMPRVALMNAYTHDFFVRTNALNVFKIFRTNAAADTLVLNGGKVGLGTAAPAQKLEVNGGMRLNTATARPACDANARGTFWFTNGGAGKDSVQVCAQGASDGLQWRTIY
jgi:hypothetical protein